MVSHKSHMGEDGGKWSTQRPHILIFMYPVPGRLIPAMVLASRLAELGAKVSYLCPSHRLPRLKEAKSRGLREGIEIVTLNIPENPMNPIPDDVYTDNELMPYICDGLREYMSNLSEHPACLIGDEVSCAIAETARSLNLKRYVLVPESALAFSATMYIRKLVEDSCIPLPDEGEPLVMDPLLKNIPLRREEYLNGYLESSRNRISRSLLDKFAEGAVECHTSEGALVNTCEPIESSILEGLRNGKEINPSGIKILPIGPLFPSTRETAAPRGEEVRCMEFLARYNRGSVIYVSFGSLARTSEEQVNAVYSALKSCGFPFIWMIRCQTGYVPNEQLEDGLILSDWAPQLRILTHSSTGLFVTHGGWNSTLESITCGVPMLVTLPRYMDQKINAKLVSEVLKVGLRVDSLDAEEIKKQVQNIMWSDETRKRASELKEKVRLAADTATENLKGFINSLKGN